MLETTLAAEFVPGTNLRGDVACADWRFLLPSLEINDLMCVGAIPLSTVGELSRSGSRVHVVLNGRRQREQTAARKDGESGSPFTVYVDGYAKLPFSDRSMDLIYIADAQAGNAILRDEQATGALARVLRPDGAVYFELHGLTARYTYGAGLEAFARRGFDASEHYWLTPLTGDLRTALPLGRRNITRYFFSSVLHGRSERTKALSRLATGLTSLGLIRHLAPRRGVVVHRSCSRTGAGSPPQYLRLIAEKTGIDVSRLRHGVSARGKFNANKVIFFLFEESASVPSAVIKMTRAEEYNPRLENEFRTLQELQGAGYLERSRYPEPLFFGHHNNLAVSCLRAVHGVPFRARTRATADCPVARDAIDCILQFGSRSAETRRVSSEEACTALRDLYERFSRIYTLSTAEDEFLADQVRLQGQLQQDFPLVFQHGDPGTWNLFVSQDDRVIILDWEAGERRGMPLWDLFYFFRTYAAWMSRMRGTRDALKSFSQHFLEPSDLGSLLQDATRRFCDGVRLDRSMVGPLFYTCWMHRALKEATRLRPDALHSGNYLNLLKLAIANRREPSLVRLFSL